MLSMALCKALLCIKPLPLSQISSLSSAWNSSMQKDPSILVSATIIILKLLLMIPLNSLIHTPAHKPLV